MNERRRRLREERRKQSPAEQDLPRPGAAAPVGAIVFALVLGLFCLARTAVGFTAASSAAPGSGWVLIVLDAAIAALCLVGTVLLVVRRPGAAATVTAGGALALLMIPVILIIASLPGNGGGSGATAAVPYVFLGVPTLVFVHGGRARRWLDRS
ncbi:hypothetical protein [Amycolatopsis anabasis]|uniref:hypothetical protein n=1 Tax=Amycolatopsis anabasis TaxID=1840409 RepID=UPI00131B2F4E|nr:hypothetical protein [Amycolatopsis anabasis]